MKVWRFLAALALTIVVGTNNSLSASPAEAVEMFRRGCLDHLPDFTESGPPFKALGFVPSRDLDEYESLRREFRGSRAVAGLRLNAPDPFNECMLIIDVQLEDDIGPLLADDIAKLSFLSFRRETNESGATEIFWWKIGSMDAVVTTFNFGSQRSIVAFVGDLPKIQELPE